MSNGNVLINTATLLVRKDGADGVADTGVITTGTFNGQNLPPCYIPSASQIPGAGSVTSVALTVPSFLSVAGSPITTAGTLAVTLATQTANKVFAGPTTGGVATPTFRALVAADVPTTLLATTMPTLNLTAAGQLKFGGNVVFEDDGASVYLSPSNDTTGSVYIFTGGAQRFQVSSTGVGTFAGTLAFKYPTASKAVTGPYAVTTGDFNTAFDTAGGAGVNVGFTLPAAVVGLSYTFNQNLTDALSQATITPAGGDTIALAAKTAGQAVASTAGARGSITLVCTAANTWAVTALVGTWT